jgi:hypothetical protein
MVFINEFLFLTLTIITLLMPNNTSAGDEPLEYNTIGTFYDTVTFLLPFAFPKKYSIA